ncbi:MAG TPA: disulfide oxidoreductase [Firmicutes bacterium]|jgi:hybrid cluster-associated redox disulfide protein|nr:disulfide oxidoreductase [Bacillota bacterium]
MITKDTRIIDALQQNPKTTEIFEKLGMGCIGCMGITMETIENGAKMHHIPLDDLLKSLNAVLEDKSS